MVISPYAKQGYIDHQTLSSDAYLKFIEDDFLGGARLNPKTDGRPDPPRRAGERDDPRQHGQRLQLQPETTCPGAAADQPADGLAVDPGLLQRPGVVRRVHGDATVDLGRLTAV